MKKPVNLSLNAFTEFVVRTYKGLIASSRLDLKSLIEIFDVYYSFRVSNCKVVLTD